MGTRIRMLGWLYLFPEVGASLYHCGDNRPTYHANLGVQFQFDLRRHQRN